MLVVSGKEVFTTLEEVVNPKHAALLLIDIQNDYVAPGGYFDKLGLAAALRGIIPPIARVLEAARRVNLLVVHVQKTLYPDHLAESPAALRARLLRIGDRSTGCADKLLPYCIEGTWGWQRATELAPLPGEIVVRKHHSSSFAGTNLDTVLRSNGIKSVVIVGLVTNGCVMSTAEGAALLEYYPVVLRDCVAGTRPALHDAALLLMSDSRDLVDSGEVLRVWNI